MNVLLAVSGGIAAYKTISLTSLLKKSGSSVQVVLTDHAQEFVTALPFETLSERDVITDMFDGSTNDPVAHVSLSSWADIFVIAPATANVIAKMAHGLADDFLSTFYLAWDGPTFIAPAMNDKMYAHPSVQNNLKILQERGVHILGPQIGHLACGTTGIGKMLEPEDIFSALNQFNMSERTLSLQNKKILVSAGPTRESLDPVRYISNHSSGKMGYAIAQAAAKAGAEVTLVSGPVNLSKLASVETIPVVSTRDMFEALTSRFDDADAVIMAAAPSDYRPATYSKQKIKKTDGRNDRLEIAFEKNPDILKWLGEHKNDQVLIGFAAESHNVSAYALEKLKKKNLDYIVANDITAENAGFAHDVNTVLFIHADETIDELPTMSKDDLAQHIIKALAKTLLMQN